MWGFGVGCGGLIGGEVMGVGLSDASTQGMDRMVCSRGGCIWLAPLRGLPSGQSAVFGAWALDRPQWSWRGTRSKSNNFSNAL